MDPLVLLALGVGAGLFWTMVRAEKWPASPPPQAPPAPSAEPNAAPSAEEQRRAAWLRLAEECGLGDVAAVSTRTWLGGLDEAGIETRVRARISSLDVDISESRSNGGSSSTRFVIEGISRAVSFRSEGIGARLEKVLAGGDLELGDPDFDRAVYVDGRPLAVRALLDHDTRQLLRDLLAGRIGGEGRRRGASMQVVVGNGVVRATFGNTMLTGEPETVRALLALAQRLQDPSEPLTRLAHISRLDRVTLVRSRALAVLVREAPADPITRSALEGAAREDPDGMVRLQAAVALGPEGRPALAALAEDPAAVDDVTAQAIDRLGPEWTGDAALRVITASRTGRRLLTAAAAARALGRLRADGCEEVLLAALDDPDDALRGAAAEALGIVGTVRAVPPLRALEQKTGGGHAKVARESIASIQQRLTGASPGQLAVTAAADGSVSLADDVRGRVHLPEPEPGDR